ncbi:hypothetical protein STEG23_012693 [Scotinomys teguina]
MCSAAYWTKCHPQENPTALPYSIAGSSGWPEFQYASLLFSVELSSASLSSSCSGATAAARNSDPALFIAGKSKTFAALHINAAVQGFSC